LSIGNGEFGLIVIDEYTTILVKNHTTPIITQLTYVQ